jgi:hypothetical protein
VARLAREADGPRAPAGPGEQRVERELEVRQLPGLQLLGQHRQLRGAVAEVSPQLTGQRVVLVALAGELPHEPPQLCPQPVRRLAHYAARSRASAITRSASARFP